MLPRLIQIGPFSLYSFGVMVILGFVAGLFLASYLSRRRGLPGDAFLDGAVFILFAAIAGARLLFVALNWRSYAGHPLDITAVWQGGMSFHGGAAAGILAGVVYMRRRGLPVLAMADAAAPGLALGYAIGRMGCFLNGCCYGGATQLPWGIHFPGLDPALAYHPTQLYALVVNLGLTGALAVAYLRPHRQGQILTWFVGGYSLYRFLIEYLRVGVTARELAAGLTEAQWFSLLAMAAATAAWFWLQRRGKPAPENAADAAGPVLSPAASGAGAE